MKNFMQPRSGILRENLLSEIQSSPDTNSQKHRSSRKKKWSKENAPPTDTNAAKRPLSARKIRSPLPPRAPSSNPNPLKRKLCMETIPENCVPGSDSGVQVIVRMRPPNKEEEGEMIVHKVSRDSFSILGHTFSFDSVADMESTQQDIFHLVGVPLVENCLAGFNSSIFAYGQTGSGKTYTMWGPANALLEENLSSDQKGLTPRVFEQLFARIDEEQVKHSDKQLKYQCYCSFLEIYNEQITDLLDPNQRNLQIREDVKSGVYVENLTEEYVYTIKDVIQLLIKGLSNRRTGATILNAESSRSHSVFTCIVESRCKSTSDGLSSFRISRINLVDLAGSERQKLTGAAGERLKEAGNINRSLSQLGNLINILAEVSQSGKQRHIPYRDSRLTFLLQESLGGNAKLAMICAISLAQSCKSETFSTLRFAQRAKAIKNKAVVNEVVQDDVNVLREVIRQLKDELLQMKANGNPADTNRGYSTSWNARRSLNLLKLSLNHPMTLPHVEDDSDEEMEIDEEAVESLCVQADLRSAGCEENNVNDLSKLQCFQSDSQTVSCRQLKIKSAMMCNFDNENVLRGQQPNDSFGSSWGSNQASEEVGVNVAECQLGVASDKDKHRVVIEGFQEPSLNAQDSSSPNGLNHQCNAESEINNDYLINTNINLLNMGSTEESIEVGPIEEKKLIISDCKIHYNGSASDSVSKLVSGDPADVSAASVPHNSPTNSPNSMLHSPTLSVSPIVNNNSRKSLRTSSAMLSASQKDLSNDRRLGPEVLHLSLARSLKRNSSNAPFTGTSKTSPRQTEHLEASLHRGLEIIDKHHKSSVMGRSSLRFSFKPVDLKPVLLVDKVDVGVQTLPQDSEELECSVFLCGNCKTRAYLGFEGTNENSEMTLLPVGGMPSADKSKAQVPKAVEKVLAGAIRREMALEEFCAKQTFEITQLNRLVHQYKHERECNAIIGQLREDKIIHLESLMDGILPTEEFMEEEVASLANEHMILKEKYENHPEVLRAKIELKRVQDELDAYRNFFDMGERDVLMEEIQHLRSQLQYYIDASSPITARKGSSLLQLTHSCEPSLAPPCAIIELTEENVYEKFKQERNCWAEAESKWISLSEELRIELEASRTLAEKQRQELDSEKKCSEELKEAMQMAMQGHARILEQYAELQEKYLTLLAGHRQIQEGIDDVKRAAVKAGVKGAESKFIKSLAAEISALKVEREKERRYLIDQNKGLQAQLRDTAEAVQAAGELLVRLKEAEEATAIAEKRALEAEQEVEKAYIQINKFNSKHEREMSNLNQILAESRLPKEVTIPDSDIAGYGKGECLSGGDEQWREEFQSEDGEFSKLTEPSSWFSGYDRCNI